MRFSHLFWYELKRTLGNGWNIVFSMLIPALTISLFAYAAAPYLFEGEKMEPFQVAVVDQEQTLETRYIINHLKNTEAGKQLLSMRLVTMEDAQTLLNNGSVAAIVIIPEGITNNLYYAEPTVLQIIGNPKYPFQAEILRDILQTGAELISIAQGGIETLWEYMDRIGMDRDVMADKYADTAFNFYIKVLGRDQVMKAMGQVSATGMNIPLEYYIVSIFIIFMFFQALSVLQPVFSDLERKTVHRIILKGGTSFHYILAKYLSVVTVQFLQYFIPGILVFLAAGNSSDSSFLLVPAGFIAISLCSCSMIMVFGYLITKMEAAIGFGFVFILLSAFLGGGIIPLAFLPETIRNLSIISPHYWAMQTLLNSTFGNHPDAVLQGTAVLVLISAVFFTCSTLLLRRATKMPQAGILEQMA